MNARIGIAVVLLVCLSTVGAGCGGPTLYPVEGDAIVEGKPLAKGTVAFWPDAEKGNTFKGQPTGSVEAGKYKVNTAGMNGAPLGWYKVTITSSQAGDSAKANIADNPVPARFREAARTPLRIEVLAKPEPGAYNLKASGS